MSQAPCEIGDRPLAYFITYTCYGTRLHGDERGTVDPAHNQPESPFLPANEQRRKVEANLMKQPAFVMDQARRIVVLKTIREVCNHRRWTLLAAHVRTTHVHLVAQGNAVPEKIMNDVKAYSSRRLNEAKLDPPDRIRWTRHGSTIYLWKMDEVEAKVHYTLYEQGDQMEVYPEEKNFESRP